MEEFITWWVNTPLLMRVILVITLAALLVQWAYTLLVYLRVARLKPPKESAYRQKVTVVICARNEEKNLRELIPLLMDQDYPEYDIVVVNDSSWDGTEDTLKAFSLTYPNVYAVHLDEDKQRMSGKKFALTIGIKAAKTDVVLLTDADCRPRSKHWISRMSAPFEHQKTEVVLGVSPYRRMGGLLNRLIRFDAAQVALTYLGMAKLGLPYMGVGRNLAYRREIFFKNGGFKSHLHISSGDDDLFVAEVANKHNTELVAAPEAQTISAPKTTWSAWMHQKRRHFTTAPLYRVSVKMLLGIWPLSLLIFWGGTALLMLVHSAFLIAGGLLLLRYALHFATLVGALRKTGQSDLIIGSPLWEFMVGLLQPALWIWNLLATPRTWK